MPAPASGRAAALATAPPAGRPAVPALSTPKPRPKAVAILGPRGTGKSTQAKRVSDEFNLCNISCGDLVRAYAGTSSWSPRLGRASTGSVKSEIASGMLVDDSVVFGLVVKALRSRECASKDGFIVDGFPRTLGQAHMFEQYLERAARPSMADKARLPWLRSADKAAADRAAAAAEAAARKKSHLDLVVELSMDIALIGKRFEAMPLETLETKLRHYHAYARPVSAYYEARGVAVDIDASGAIDEVAERVLTVMGAAKRGASVPSEAAGGDAGGAAQEAGVPPSVVVPPSEDGEWMGLKPAQNK